MLAVIAVILGIGVFSTLIIFACCVAAGEADKEMGERDSEDGFLSFKRKNQ